MIPIEPNTKNDIQKINKMTNTNLNNVTIEQIEEALKVLEKF